MWGLGDVDKHPVMSRKILITSTCQPITLEKKHDKITFAINTFAGTNFVPTISYFSFAISQLTGNKCLNSLF